MTDQVEVKSPIMKRKAPEEACSQLQATGHVSAQSWVIEKALVRIGRKKIDARIPSDLAIWPDTSAEISDKTFQAFWVNASAKDSYSTEWNESKVRGTAAIGLQGGGTIDHDILVDIKRSEEVARKEIIASLAAEVRQHSRAFPASSGVVGFLQPLGSPGSRPGFTLVVAGRYGGSEAAHVLLQGFGERGISGLLGRQIQNDKYGIIRGLFVPEWFSHFRDRNGGIDWVAWQTAARSDFEQSFYEAMLVWSDEILKAIDDLKEEGNISVQSIFLDSYAAVILLNNSVEQTLSEISRLNQPDSISALEICRSYLMGFQNRSGE
jgi:hypothetical protein